MISDKEIKSEKYFYEHLKRQYKKKLSYYPKGEIYFKYQHGKHRPYIKIGNEKRYLAKEEISLISKLLNKKIDNVIIKNIEENITVLDHIQSKYKGIEYILGDSVIKEIEMKIGRGFKVSDFLLPPNKTQSANFCQDKKIHKTPANIKVRSRAELVIATFLEMKGIEYIYEQTLKLPFRTAAPDFTIIRKSDGKKIIWEHFGMMDNPGYYESRMELLTEYHEAGWLPYENFIATFGEKDSPIDMTTLETICETMLR